MIPLSRAVVAAAVTVVAAAALAGCAGSGSGAADQVGAAPSGHATAGPAGDGQQGRQAAADGGPTEPEPTEPADPAVDVTPTGPTVPDAELTPVTGSFTEQEVAYLSDRVPVGTDPAAVLQLGQETCDRITAMVRVDRDAVVSELVAGEIANAQAAVTHLCPDQESVLKDAVDGFADGTYTVGEEIAPGTYRAVGATGACRWSADSTTGTDRRVTIPADARTFTSGGCYAWLREGGGS